jgi:hypothetical protein
MTRFLRFLSICRHLPFLNHSLTSIVTISCRAVWLADKKQIDRNSITVFEFSLLIVRSSSGDKDCYDRNDKQSKREPKSGRQYPKPPPSMN